MEGILLLPDNPHQVEVTSLEKTRRTKRSGEGKYESCTVLKIDKMAFLNMIMWIIMVFLIKNKNQVNKDKIFKIWDINGPYGIIGSVSLIPLYGY